MREDFIRIQQVCIYDEIGMFAGVGKAALLLFMVGGNPVEFAAGGGVFKGTIKEDEDIRLADYLPHVFDIGMFLRDVTAAIAAFFQFVDQCGFPRAARTNDTDEQRAIFVFHFREGCG